MRLRIWWMREARRRASLETCLRYWTGLRRSSQVSVALCSILVVIVGEKRSWVHRIYRFFSHMLHRDRVNVSQEDRQMQDAGTCTCSFVRYLHCGISFKSFLIMSSFPFSHISSGRPGGTTFILVLGFIVNLVLALIRSLGFAFVAVLDLVAIADSGILRSLTSATVSSGDNQADLLHCRQQPVPL